MVLVNNNWEQVKTLRDVIKIIRENYNEELADELDELIPEHTDEEYEKLEWKYGLEYNKVAELENEVDDLRDEIERLEIKIEELEGEKNDS